MLFYKEVNLYLSGATDSSRRLLRNILAQPCVNTLVESMFCI